MWPSEWARTGAVALLGSSRVVTHDDRRLPRGASAGALAVAWSRQIVSLCDALLAVDGKTPAEAAASLTRVVLHVTRTDYVLERFNEEVARAPVLEERAPSPARIDVSAILGVHRRPAVDDGGGMVEEEAVVPSHRPRSRSSSFDEHRRRRY